MQRICSKLACSLFALRDSSVHCSRPRLRAYLLHIYCIWGLFRLHRLGQLQFIQTPQARIELWRCPLIPSGPVRDCNVDAGPGCTGYLAPPGATRMSRQGVACRSDMTSLLVPRVRERQITARPMTTEITARPMVVSFFLLQRVLHPVTKSDPPPPLLETAAEI